MESRPSDLVLDTQIQVEFDADLTHRFTIPPETLSGQYVRRKQRKETWQVQKLLGSGSCSTVFLQKCLTSEGPVELQAVKAIHKPVVSECIPCYKELEAIAKFSQRKYEGLFVKFFGWYENGDFVFIIMEYMKHGDLESHLKGPLPEEEACHITLQLAEGLQSLHDNGFAHRDLKPANIFVARKGPDWWVKLGNFGSSKRVNDDEGPQFWLGTPLFMAPEIQMSYYLGANSYSETSDCTEKVDMWALGVMTYYMLFHDYPFSPSKPVPLSQYARDTALSFPESALQPISQDCYTFIKATMDPDATKRMSAKEAVQSKWLKSLETPVAEINRDGLTGTKLTSAASGEEVQTAQELSQAIPTETVEVLPNNSDRSSNGNMRADQSPRNSDPLTEDHTSAVQADTLKTNQLGAGTPDFANPKGGITEVAEDLPLHSLQRFHTEGVRLYHQKEYNEAEIMLQKAANGRSQKLGLTDHDTRNSFHCLGVLYYHMRKYSKSRSLFRRVLEIQEKEFGQIHQSTLKTEYWIGITMLRSGIYTKGRLALKRVANIQKHVLGPNHPDTLLSLSELDQKHHSEVSKSSNIYSSPNVYPEVPSLEMIELTKVMRKAVQALKADLWPEHHSISFRRDYKRVTVKLPPNSSQPIAESQPLESVSSKVKTHYRTMAELGQWLHGKGHYQAAQSSLEMAVSGLNQYFESTDIKLMDALYWLGWNQFKLNQYEKAELTFREARNRWKRHHGFSRRHFDHAIGLALFKQGKYAMAEDTLDLSGLCDTTLFELGLILCNQGKFDEAKKSFKDAFFKQAHHGADYSGYWIQRIRHYWSDYEVPKACNVKLPGQTRTKIKLTRRTDLWPRSG